MSSLGSVSNARDAQSQNDQDFIQFINTFAVDLDKVTKA